MGTGSGDASKQQESSKLTPIDQDWIAEAGRMAIKHNLVALCEGACNLIAWSTQGTLRSRVWTEYSKAELILKKPWSKVDFKTGMKLNLVQQQTEEFERRVEALKILDRAMISNKWLLDPDVIHEGAILIWNTALPLLKSSTWKHVAKAFASASQMFEQIKSSETKLRV